MTAAEMKAQCEAIARSLGHQAHSDCAMDIADAIAAIPVEADPRDAQIAALTIERDDLKSDYLRRHKDATDRYEQIAALRDDAIRAARTSIIDQYAPGSCVAWQHADNLERAIRAALAASAPKEPRRYRHLKRGSTYTKIVEAEVQASSPIREGDSVTVFRSEDGRAWVRPSSEFYDGRFEQIDGDTK